MDELIAQTAERIFADHRDQPAALWTALSDSGLAAGWTLADGGTDLSLVDGFGLIRLAAAFAEPVPLAPTLLAARLLAWAGIAAPSGAGAIVSVQAALAGDAVDASFAAVEFGAELDWLVCLADRELLLLPAASQCRALPTHGDDPRADIQYQGCRPLARASAPQWLDADALQLLAALMRAAQLCGAMEAALDLSLQFTAQREQFGRSLSKFQAIQHMLSEIAGEVSASSAALDAAVEQVGSQGAELLSAAAAKARASEAAGIVGAHAHQVHGAIGYTQEYALARLTRRLWRWRDQHGDESHWSAVIGREILSCEPASFAERVFSATPPTQSI